MIVISLKEEFYSRADALIGIYPEVKTNQRGGVYPLPTSLRTLTATGLSFYNENFQMESKAEMIF